MDETGSAYESEAQLLRDPNLHVIFGVTMMAVHGVSSITPAFPDIAVALGLTPHQVGLLVAVFTLPEYRNEGGTWYTFEQLAPGWFAGPGLYEMQPDGTWLRLTTDNDLTLDEVLQLHDPPPRPPSADTAR